MDEDTQDQLEIERLRNEIQQEGQMKQMLEQSMNELKQTVEELELRCESVENEGNEWKTRFETQEEMNQQLRRQAIALQDKVEASKRSIKEVVNKDPDSGRTPRDAKSITLDELADATSYTVKAMEKEKQSLEGQLKDLAWRIDQESKAYHKANDERKQYQTEINAAKSQMEDFRARRREALRQSGVTTSTDSVNTPRNLRNIPQDQRIIDPKRGPIRKTAAVKTLPSIHKD